MTTDSETRGIDATGSVVVARPRSRFTKSAAIEFAVIVALGIGYTLIRAAQGDDPSVALRHAHRIIDAESWVYHHIEHPMNHWLNGVAVLAVPACYFYAVFHYAATPLVFWKSWRVGGWLYKRGYWTLIIATAMALAMYASFPVAPPRLVPGLGAIDVMREYASYGWWGGAASAPAAVGDATNQFAAMPSMHCGWALWCGIQMWSFGTKHKLVWRVLAVAYPTMEVLVVVATGNHYILDVVGGVACVLIAFTAVTLVGRKLEVRKLIKSSISESPH